MRRIHKYSEKTNVSTGRPKTELLLEGSRKRFGSWAARRRTGDSEHPTTVCYQSTRWNYQLMAGSRAKMLSWRSLRDWCPVCWQILWSNAVLASAHHHAEFVLDALSTSSQWRPACSSCSRPMSAPLSLSLWPIHKTQGETSIPLSELRNTWAISPGKSPILNWYN